MVLVVLLGAGLVGGCRTYLEDEGVVLGELWAPGAGAVPPGRSAPCPHRASAATTVTAARRMIGLVRCIVSPTILSHLVQCLTLLLSYPLYLKHFLLCIPNILQ